MWDLTIHPLWGPTSSLTHVPQGSASLLAHHLVFDSDTICNSPNPPLIDIVFFRLSLKVFKTHLLGKRFLIKNVLFPLQPMWDLTIHPPRHSVLADTPSLLQSIWDITVHPLRGSASLLAHRSVFDSDTICNNPSSPLADSVLFGLSLSRFPSRFLKRVC